MSRSSSPIGNRPFALHYVNGRYLIFEVSILKHIREVHHICGVLIGTLPQISQQNVFLGLPLQLMPEEAAYLVRHDYAYVVDDREVHRNTIASISEDQLEALKSKKLTERALKEAATRKAQLQKKRAALEQRGLTHLLGQLSVDDADSVNSIGNNKKSTDSGYTHVDTVSNSLIYQPDSSADTSMSSMQPSPSMPRYDLFSHLHAQGYFMTPGLRFGAQFVAYPGDPLRFHSHFVASGHAWDVEIPIMDVVGGGRLGTGVKKAWLIGGKRPDNEEVKCFTIEWAGM